MLHVAASTTEGGVRVETRDGRALAVAYPHEGRRVTTSFSAPQPRPRRRRRGGRSGRRRGASVPAPSRPGRPRSPTGRSGWTWGGLADEPLSLADAGPLLLTSEASLDRLQQWVGPEADLAMARFRPNVVIDGHVPFEEDTWDRVRLGDVELRVQQTCDRCVLTTIDPVSLEKGKEPIRTLSRHRKWDGAVWFGVWLAPLGTGRIHLGDALSVG